MARDTDPAFTGQTFDEASMLARKAVELAHRHRTPPVPKVFEVWFTYAGDLNDTISTRIDRALDEAEPLQPAFLHKLHEEVLSPGAVGEGVARIGDRMDNDLAEVVDLIEDGMAASDAYATKLKRIDRTLTGNVPDVELRRVLSQLRDANRGQANTISRLSDSMMSLRAQFTGMQKELRELRQRVLIDHATQLPNRRRFDEALENGIGQARRSGTPLAVIVADIDHFRAFNDRWGRAMGDRVIVRFAEVLRMVLRDGDMPARIGGKEFGLVLPATSLDAAREIAEALRQAFGRQQLVRSDDQTPMANMTASFGVTVAVEHDTPMRILARLEDYVMRAKEAGRNQIWSAS